MSVQDRKRWDAKYAERSVPDELTPDAWLTDLLALSPLGARPPGRALELACGYGQNAIWLARRGWQVDAIDVSPVGLKQADRLAARCGAGVNWIAADLDVVPLPEQAYDLIVVFRFLDRKRLPQIIPPALKPGGLLVYETFSRSELDRPGTHLRNPDFTLAPGELPELFASLKVLRYEETDLPDRSVARLIAQAAEASASD